MKHVSIVGKFFIIMAVFGIMALGLTFYQSWQMLKVNDSYQELLDRDASAALRLTSRTEVWKQRVPASATW
ncbi:hypothetical protein ACOJBO_08940 [Rhizobium beringeri]